MYHLIYITINLINWKFYLGKHTTDNLNDGYLGSGYILKKAIKKYGKENFRRVDLEFLNSEKDANEREKQLINHDFLIKFREHCYNVGCGGFGGDNISMHPNRDKIIQKISRSSIEKWKDLEYHERTKNSIAKTLQTKGHRKLRSDIAKILWENDTYRTKTTNATKKAQSSEESKNKKSTTGKTNWQNPIYRNKIMTVLRSKEHRKILSDAAKKLYRERPEIKKIQGETRSKTLQLPEFKKKMSDTAKLRYKTSIKMQKALTEGRMGDKNPGWGSKWMYNPETKQSFKVQKENINQYLDNGWKFGRLKRTKN